MELKQAFFILKHGSSEGLSEYLKAIKTIEDNCPPVVHGRWERCFEDWRKQIEGDKCSACGFEHYGTSVAHYHYCPNCGAKMDMEADGE